MCSATVSDPIATETRSRRELVEGGNPGAGIGYLIPAATITVLLGVLPLAALACFSLFDWSLTRANSGSFVGIRNYVAIASDPAFWHALTVTVQISIETVVLQLVLGVSIALLLNRNLYGMGIIRALVMTPMMMAPLFAGLIWRLALSNDFGIIPYLISAAGIDNPPLFLSDARWAIHAIVIVTAWQTIPFVVLFVIAALQTIPGEIYEAARLDGARSIRIFVSITLPLIRSVLVTIALFNVIDSVKIFDPIYAMTTGGPGNATESLSYLIYLQTSTFFNLGYGSALAITTLAIVSVPVMLILHGNARASRPSSSRGA